MAISLQIPRFGASNMEDIGLWELKLEATSYSERGLCKSSKLIYTAQGLGFPTWCSVESF